MAQSDKPKKLFKVASEFNVSTQSIVDALADQGLKINNRPNSKVTPEMYSVLEQVYGMDKAKSREHERAREEYESRRSEIHSKRNQSVTVESFLEPIDEGEEEDLPLEPKGDVEPDLEPQEQEEEPDVEPEAAEEESDKAEKAPDKVEKEKKDKSKKAQKETKPEPKKEKPVESKEEESADKEEAEAKEKADAEQEKAKAKKEEAEAKKKEAEKAQKEKEARKAAEEKKKAEEQAKEEAKKKEKEAETAKAEKSDKQEAKEQKKAEPAQAKEETEKKEPEKEEKAKKQAAKADKEKQAAEKKESKEEQAKEDEKEANTDKEKEEKKVIRGRASRLKGTKVVGKVDIGSKDEGRGKKRKKRKKRKRKQTRAKEDSGNNKKSQSKSGNDKSKKDDSGRKKRKKRKSRGRRKRVDEEDVERKMKETMRRMQQSEGVGRKRQKRRRQKREEREEELQQQQELEQLEKDVIEVTEFITVNDLADMLDVGVNDVITTCMNLGMMVSINQRLDASTIELVAEEYNKEVDFVDAEEMMEEIETEEDDPEDLKPRAPVITVMGHVDHGKTSLLDYVRKTKVVAGEAGGITQHVGAYEVEVEDGERSITFLDTPGHEAFTAMRSRGAQATDIVILVVAADDAVMPQTIEAINHAKAAGVPIIVAINKIDKPGANPEKIKQQLAEHDVIVEEYGGKNQSAEVSAKTGEGIDELLEKVLIEADLMELKANPDRRAEGIVLETKVDKGKGIVANILIQKGTLHVGDAYVAGPCFGRVRAMEDEFGIRLEEAGPSKPMQLMGFDDMPKAGDRLVAFKDEKKAKDIANQRQQIRREQELRKTKHLSLDELSRRMALGEVSELNIIIKADVDGSIEALSGSLQKLSNDEVKVNIIHTGAGAITESDVLLASASDAIIIGFQVRPTSNARKLAEEEEIDIRLFSVIYDAVDEVHDALEGMLSPEIKEKVLGNVEVRETFKVPNVGTVAGCYVTDGKINRNSQVRLIRDGVVIYEGEIGSLKRFKDDVKEVASGYECGLNIQNYNDIKVGDTIEVYTMIEEKRKLVTNSDN